MTNNTAINSDIFESQKWVITRNDQGTVKLATCEEDETCLYEKSRDWIEVDEVKTKTKANNFKTSKNIARFFIRDLLNAEEKDGCFICKNISFTTVYLCGNVVDKHVNTDNYFLDVDDGTGVIRCVLTIKDLMQLKSANDDLDTCTNWLWRNEKNDSILLKGARIMMSSLNHVQKSIPTFDEIEMGTTVKIIGVIKQYAHGKNIFIKKIHKDNSSLAFSVYLEDLVGIYKEQYSVESETTHVMQNTRIEKQENSNDCEDVKKI